MIRISLDSSWRFLLNPERNMKYRSIPGDRVVDLPHDFSMELPRRADAPGGNYMGFFQGGIGLYERDLPLPANWKDKRVYLEFEGVYQQASVKVNSHMVCRRPNGYVSFICDVTEQLLNQGENTLQVIADNRAQPNSRWYSGSGIYRHVWMHLGNRAGHISPYGLYGYTRSADDQEATLCVQATLADAAENAKVVFRLIDTQGDIAAEGSAPCKAGTAQTELRILCPKLWLPESPNLYTLQAKVISGEKFTDTQEIRLGIRTLTFDSTRGMCINGRPYKMKGGCVHHDCGILGAASYDDAEYRKVQLLKACGYNAVRCSHNPPAPSFLDACDELGMLVIDEAFDSWRECKSLNTQDYSVFFEDWWERDLRSMVLRDRNHPSIVLWSTGNEIIERDGRSGGYKLAQQLAQTIRRYDESRGITNGMCGFWGEEVIADLEDQFGAVTEKFIEPLDVAGYNYLLERYEGDHVKYPDRVICCTESYSTKVQEYWEAVERYPWVIGDFVWTAQDYFGEAGCGRVVYQAPREHRGPWPWHQAWCGDLDICGKKRPQSFFRDCVWGLANEPYIVVYDPARFGQTQLRSPWAWPDVFHSWTWPGMEGHSIAVDVYACEDEVELLLNGCSLGRQPAGRQHGYTAHFEGIYAPGVLEAIGYRAGKAVSRSAIETASPPCHLRLEAEATSLTAEKGRLVYIHVTVEDEQGRLVPYADPQLYFSACGGAKIAAVGTADPVSTESYRGMTRRAHQGRAMVVLESTGAPEDAYLTVMAEGYPSAQICIPVQKGAKK